MNKFKADFATNKLLLDIPEPKNLLITSSSFTKSYQKDLEKWNSRLSYSLSPELKAMLINGQVLQENEFALKEERVQMFSELIAIPLPDSNMEAKSAEWRKENLSGQTNKVKEPNCSQHPKELFGESDMKKVAKAIRDMHHEARAILISELANEISAEGWEDEPTKPNLSAELFIVAGYLTKAAIHSNFVWDISKKFMDNQPSNT